MREWLIHIREKEKLTQKDVGSLCNISDAYYCMIEKGTRKPTVKLAKLIARKMNFSVYSKDWTSFFN